MSIYDDADRIRRNFLKQKEVEYQQYYYEVYRMAVNQFFKELKANNIFQEIELDDD